MMNMLYLNQVRYGRDRFPFDVSTIVAASFFCERTTSTRLPVGPMSNQLRCYGTHPLLGGLRSSPRPSLGAGNQYLQQRSAS